ncbi:hypothetical protein [Aliivibrio fischeri]|uniref:hypothetical protein n=1 Tax=Aliivibrio fischeri TaxID=668 RepID=UPI00084C3CCE|nr:hypothetical protein [Aliivibrio fischeri]OED51071.1 hypothetical protein BEI47_10530 [Aliivibrio fischeri]
MNRKEYKKCCDDEVDWTTLDQLHEATLQISNQCFEYKKLCVGILGVVVTALLKVEPKTSFSIIALVCIVISCGFWICDTTAYFYQKANRKVMSDVISKIKTRNEVKIENKSLKVYSWSQAFFNRSMHLYYYIFFVCFTVILIENLFWVERTY